MIIAGVQMIVAWRVARNSAQMMDAVTMMVHIAFGRLGDRDVKLLSMQLTYCKVETTSFPGPQFLAIGMVTFRAFCDFA